MEGSIKLSPIRHAQVKDAMKNIRSASDDIHQYLVTNSIFKTEFETTITGSIEQEWSRGQNMFKFVKDAKIDEDLYIEETEKRNNNAQYKKMLLSRKSLPSYSQYNTLVNKIMNNKVILVSGEAGCGKTTQIPQFVLENCIDRRVGSQTYIVCTQPRRISAIAVAHRVAQERGEELCNSVGYQIQLEKYMPRERGGILFCTTGILLRWMMSDPLLTQVSHILVDEVHERDINSDFLLTLLKDLIKSREDLRVIVMSASLNSRKFSNYFNGCPIVDIPGKMFPVQEFFLEDVLKITGYQYVDNRRYKPELTYQERRQRDEELCKIESHLRVLRYNYSPQIVENVKSIEMGEVPLELIVDLIVHIHRSNSNNGAILVFLTGWGPIDIITNSLQSKLYSGGYIIHQLHSLLPTADQAKVFEKPPTGVRKIILSTNLAETSVTIDDVFFVIDCGRIKVGKYDAKTKISVLEDEWVSKASADQRKGRAGRVQNGICYRLYMNGRQHFFQPDIVPEINRSSLEQVILQTKLLKLGLVVPFFSKLMDKPPSDAVTVAIEVLTSLKALEFDETLTPLGYHLAQMQIEPNLAKMLILGALFSCFDPIASIAACLSFRDPFPVAKKNEQASLKLFKRNKSGNQKSDHILLAVIVAQWEQAENLSAFCREHKVDSYNMKYISSLKAKLTERVYDMNFLADNAIRSPANNKNSGNIAIIKAVICGGLYPNVAVISNIEHNRNRLIPKLITPGTDEKLTIHPKSLIENAELGRSKYVVYYKKMRYSKNNQLHDCSVIKPLPILFFCHTMTSHMAFTGVQIKLDNNLRFVCDSDLAQTIKDLRKRLDILLEHKVNYPAPIDHDSDSVEASVLKAITTLLTAEEEEY